MPIALFFAPTPTPTHVDAAAALVLILGCLPVIMLLAGAVALLRKRRPGDFIEGVCGRCGYNLQGLPVGTTCPECGADTSLVGTRRPRRTFAGGAWLACAMWVVLLVVINSHWKFEIEGYFLRLLWGIEYHGRWMPTDHPAKAYRLASLTLMLIAGVSAILWISRRQADRRR